MHHAVTTHPFRLQRARRVARRMPRRLAWWLEAGTAPIYRKLLLGRVNFVGVTGSTGKTTTKDLIHAVLSSELRGNKSERTENIGFAKTLLQTRPWHRFCVQEVAAAIRGEIVPLEGRLAVLRPKIGVVTNIGTDHLKAFGSLDAIAAEKARLVAALPRRGTAILNADDPRVLGMRSRCKGRVVTYGFALDADVRAENARCRWPDRLSFDVTYGGESLTVSTQLCGLHMVHCVLAAIAVALEFGVPLSAAVPAISKVQPSERRMASVIRPDGIAFIRDDFKSPYWSIGPALRFMEDATAPRKIVVVGTFSDYSGSSDPAFAKVARAALDVADQVLFVGPKSHKCRKADDHPRADALHRFFTVDAAAEYLGVEMRSGDLILLKGSAGDELGRLCAVEAKGRAPIESPEVAEIGLTSPGARALWGSTPPHIIVSIANTRGGHKNAPQDVGHRALDCLAERTGATWRRLGNALVATRDDAERRFALVKPMVQANNSGPLLLSLSKKMGFQPDECLLVHDDPDVPLGRMLVATGEGNRAHRGVRSVLLAFGTDSIARFRLGARLPERLGFDPSAPAVRSLSADDLNRVDGAIAQAAACLQEFISVAR